MLVETGTHVMIRGGTVAVFRALDHLSVFLESPNMKLKEALL